MTGQRPLRLGAEGQRRVERVLTPEFVADLPNLAIGVLRERRNDAVREEEDLSYLRRLLHGRIDILRAETQRRAEAAEGAESVLARLPSILTDPPSDRTTSARHMFVTPRLGSRHSRDHSDLLGDIQLSDLASCDDDQLAAALADFEEDERRVSWLRQRVQRVADQCGAELARRYREGNAKIEDVLTAARLCLSGEDPRPREAR